MKALIPLTLAGAIIASATSAHAVLFTVYTTKAAFDTATSTTLAEDFEGVAPGDLNTPLASFSRNGITYTPFAGAPFPNVFIAGAPVDYTNFGPDIPVVAGTQLTSHVMTANGDEDIRADFATPHLAFGFDTYYNGLGPLIVNLLDASDAVVGSITVPFGKNPTDNLADEGFLGVLADTPIWGFQFTSTLGGRLNTGFDNIAVGGPAIPEPASWALMIAGFGLAGAALRRRRAAAA